MNNPTPAQPRKTESAPAVNPLWKDLPQLHACLKRAKCNQEEWIDYQLEHHGKYDPEWKPYTNLITELEDAIRVLEAVQS